MILRGDCLEQMRTLAPNTVDSIVTDPPYGLSFMGKKWDYDVPTVEIWREALRVLKPGGHLLAFGGTRTYHRLAVNIEDAGFEIRDQIQWIYGSGFPKSMDVSKAIDKAAGAEREVVGKKIGRAATPINNIKGMKLIGGESGGYDASAITAPATDAAKQWQGWGTNLKPANEPICVARKPLEAKLTVAQNVQKYGTGALNIDASRIGYAPGDSTSSLAPCRLRGDKSNKKDAIFGSANDSYQNNTAGAAKGRWPANVILDEEAGRALDIQVSKTMKMHDAGKQRKAEIFRVLTGDSGINFKGKNGTNFQRFGDSGGASRFFKVIPSTEHAIETECKTTVVNNAELNSQIIQAIEQIVKTLFARESATQFLDSVNLYLTASDAELNAKNIEQHFVQSLAKALAKIDHQLKACLDFTRELSDSIQLLNHAIVVVMMASTDITMITLSLKRLSGCACLVTDAIITWARKDLSSEPGPTRFRYVAKASKRERNQGLSADVANVHPTVKPIALMEYLIRLVTPIGGTVLDPFMGSGTTGVACRNLKFKFIGCELNDEYVAIAEKRIEASK